ncbi:MAG: Wzz/FepE/Etk N-terminal domain-containing protein [Bacteroidia bacterium]
MTEQVNEPLESIDFLRFLYSKRKPILFTVIGALVLATVVTLVLPKRYSSSAIIFPVYNNNVESVIENPVFGYDVEADRLLQLLESDEVRDSVVTKFDLMNYYEINKSSPDWSDQLRQNFLNDVEFERTPYMSIVIKVVTRQPELSAEMANYIIQLADGVRGRIFKRNELAAFQQAEKEFVAKQTVVDTLKKRINILRGETHSDLVALVNMQGFVQTLGGERNNGTNTELERLLNQYIFEQSRLNDIAGRYERAKAHYESPITQVYVVDRARVSYKKVSPSLLLNLFIAGFCSLIFSITFLLFLEKLRLIRQSL